MPGKSDNQNPFSHEFRQYDAGWRNRYSRTTPGTNPYDQTTQPLEYAAWQAGSDEADANTAGEQRMPATTGAPPVP